MIDIGIGVGVSPEEVIRRATNARKDERRICIMILEGYIAEQEDDDEYPAAGCCLTRLREALALLKARDGYGSAIGPLEDEDTEEIP